jgi:hypothetical protein
LETFIAFLHIALALTSPMQSPSTADVGSRRIKLLADEKKNKQQEAHRPSISRSPPRKWAPPFTKCQNLELHLQMRDPSDAAANQSTSPRTTAKSRFAVIASKEHDQQTHQRWIRIGIGKLSSQFDDMGISPPYPQPIPLPA